MPGIKMSAMAEMEQSITVEWFGETADMVVLPGRVTREMVAGFDAEEATDGIIEQVVTLVKSWDVLGDDGEPLPVTVEVAQKLPLMFLAAIVREVVESVAAQGKG